MKISINKKFFVKFTVVIGQKQHTKGEIFECNPNCMSALIPMIQQTLTQKGYALKEISDIVVVSVKKAKDSITMRGNNDVRAF